MSLTVSVTDRCTGHGQCFIHCPNVFVPDEEGFSTVPDPSAVGGHEAEVRRAASACPERAIEIIEA